MNQDFTPDRLDRLFRMSHSRVTWRHDIDYDPQCALEMAKFARHRGVFSTFYVMPRSEHYNAFSPSVAQILRDIVVLGHKLGVHTDLGLARDEPVAAWLAARHVRNDHALLASEYPMTRRVSFHQPPKAVMWRDVQGFDCAQGVSWEGRYVADSRGVWRDSPENRLAAGDTVQINLHPEWWFWPSEKTDEWRAKEALQP